MGAVVCLQSGNACQWRHDSGGHCAFSSAGHRIRSLRPPSTSPKYVGSSGSHGFVSFDCRVPDFQHNAGTQCIHDAAPPAETQMSQRILVTGGAGCIGSELAETLVGRGHDVTVIDNLSSGKEEHIASLLSNDRFHFVKGDLLDADLVDSVVAGKEMVFHLAANPDVKFTPGDATDKDLKQNTIATYHVLECLRRRGVRLLAFS